VKYGLIRADEKSGGNIIYLKLGLVYDTRDYEAAPENDHVAPILGFDTTRFLTGAAALGLAMIASYFYWKAFSLEKKKWYWIAFFFFLLAGLIKLSSLMMFFAFLVIQIYILIFRQKEKSWFNQPVLLVPYFVVAVVIFAWYSYARYYNSHNLAGLLLQGILPIWTMDGAVRSAIWTSFHKEMLPSFFSETALYINLANFLSLFVFLKKMNRYLFFLNLLMFLGAIGFILLFFQVFNV